ncbi:MAG TPA: hypothetical protein VF733_01460 [Candidatus Saccharimonadales bacterium]
MAKEEHKKPKTHTSSSHASDASGHGNHAHGHKKVFDVMRPGKAPASATSRPVLASQKPPVADDQFVPTAPTLRASDPSRKHDLLDSKNRKALTPIDSDSAKGANGAASDSGEISSTVTAPELPANSTGPVRKKSQDELDEQKTTEASDKGVAQTDVPGNESDSAAVSSAPIWELDDESTPAHLAMEQVVDADDGIESHHLHGQDASGGASSSSANDDASSRSASTAWSSPGNNSVPNKSVGPKTIDELLAETGAPALDNEPVAKGPIISHHKHPSHGSAAGPLIVIFILLLLAALIFNVLLDSGLIDTPYDIPHTNFL